jgi:hypothetical protein
LGSEALGFRSKAAKVALDLKLRAERGKRGGGLRKRKE